MTDDEWRGGCLCGEVRYRADAAPLWIAHCHCRSCRRNTGSAVATFAGFAAERLCWQGKGGEFASSPGVMRRFCPRCGTPLSYEADRFPGEVHILVGTLDEPARAVPTRHVHFAEALPWLRLDDGLPRHPRSGDDSTPRDDA